MDDDERQLREQAVASTMDSIFVLVRLARGEWTPEVEDAFDRIRASLCSDLGVRVEDVARRET